MVDEPTSISFIVMGKPVPQGSMNAYPYRKASGKMGVRMTHKKSSALESWREEIRNAFIEKNTDGFFASKGEGVELGVLFILQPSKSNKDKYPVKKIGDLDKFVRAVNDALTGTAFEDDCQILKVIAEKTFTDCDADPCTLITLSKIK